MKRGYLGVAMATLLTTGCPSGGLLSELSARGGAGGGGTNHLLFTVEPSNAAANNIITPGIQVTVQDSLGRPDSLFTASVTVSILNNPVGGTLSGTTSVVPFNGIAFFGDLIIHLAGNGYTLQATAPGATSAASNAFTIR
jgi:hypothetical protein